MPINPAIALGVKGLELPDPLAQYSRVAAIQQAQQQNALAQMQMQEYARSLKEGEEIRNRLAAGANFADPTFQNFMLGTKTGRDALQRQAALVSAQTEEEKRRAELRQKVGETYRDLTNIIKNRDDAVDWLTKFHTDPAMQNSPLARFPLEQLTQRIPSDPEGLDNWIKQSAVGYTKWVTENKPHFVSQDTGGIGQVLAIPGRGGAATVVPGSVVAKTPTPGELLADKRARDRLAAEQEQGNYSPETIEYLASMYNQTGQLPALGLGKKAGDVKMQILDRARQLGTQAPPAAPGEAPAAAPTPQEAAEAVARNKQTRAAEQATLRAFSSGVEARSVRAFSTAVNHLDTMLNLATALKNNDIPAFNMVSNAFAKNVGAPAPTNFDTAKSIVGGEVAKALTGSNMALKDREEIRDAIARSNSPEQLAGAVRTLQELMGGQLMSLKLQYESGTNRKDFDSRLTPRAKEVIKSLKGGAATPGRPAAALPSGFTLDK